MTKSRLAGRRALAAAALVCALGISLPAWSAGPAFGLGSFTSAPPPLRLDETASGIQQLSLTPAHSYHPLPQEAADSIALRLNSSSAIGGQLLYFDAGYAPDRDHLGSGIGFGDTIFSFVQGGASQSADDLAPAFGLGAPYLRGLNPVEYRYSGAGIAQALGEAGGAYFGALRMESEGRVEHQVFYGGIGGRHVSADYLSVDQLGTEIGSALGLGLHLGVASLGYQQLRSDDGEKLHRFRLYGTAGRYGDLALQYETGQSPFTAREEDRLLLSFRANWGVRGLFSQNGSTAPGEAEARHARAGWITAAAIGGAAVAAALVAGSSGDEDENGGKGGSGFAKQHDAAFAVLNAINPVSVRENREYGGWVFREGNGSYGYTVPKRGSPDGVDPGTPGSAPGGTIATAGYHTHAAFDPRYDNENFSPQDISFANLYRVDEYLGTPAGAFKYYEYASGRVSTLGRIAN